MALASFNRAHNGIAQEQPESCGSYWALLPYSSLELNLVYSSLSFRKSHPFLQNAHKLSFGSILHEMITGTCFFA